jgi:hypothetical protein
MTDAVEPAAVWKRGLAATLDFFTAFAVFGWLIGHFTGHTTDNGFNLTGGWALLFAAAMIAYFYIGRRVAGGTLWDRILGIGRPQPKA